MNNVISTPASATALPVLGTNVYGISMVGFAIVAIVGFFKHYFPRVNGGVTILLAALLGGLAGLLQVDGLDPVSGIALGLASVGVHTVTKNMGGK